MDPHVRWLRRHLISRVLGRLAVETAIVVAVTGLVTARAGVGPLLVGVTAVVGGHLFALARLSAAIVFNPINHRYLTRWLANDGGVRPRQVTATDQRGETALHSELAEIGLRPLLTLGSPEHGSLYELHASPSRLIVTATASSHSAGGSSAVAGRSLTALSRLADGRVLVTSPEVIPPHRALLINRSGDPEPTELVLDHLDRLDLLQQQGLVAVGAGHDVVTDQLRFEWEAWNELGPFVGPLLAVDTRRQLHLLQVPVSAGQLWSRTTEAAVEQFVRHRFRAPVGDDTDPWMTAPEVSVEVRRPDRDRPRRLPAPAG
ncbi:MAG: hypothetical protein ACR2QK_19945 [Acidimicrobiales bacterium]